MTEQRLGLTSDALD